MKRILLLTAALGLAGCAVGPDFERPAALAAKGYRSGSLPSATVPVAMPGGATQHFAVDLDIPAQWWELFHSPKLNRLVEQALSGNPNIDAARAALRQARELSAAQKAAFFPTVSGNFSQTRAKDAIKSIATPVANGFNPYYSIYTAQLAVSYVPDVFGGTRRASEAAEAQAEAQRFQLEATYLTLTSNVVVTAIAEASLRGQISATERLLALSHQMTGMIQQQRAAGGASNLDFLAQQSAEAQIAATLPPLQKQLAQTRDGLTALLGRPSAEEPVEQVTLDDFALPEQLPVSLPSKLIEQRPDVRQAEETMHAASAQVGVALANMLPQFAITGGIGSSANQIQQLFTPGNGFWSIGSSLTQTLFDAGALIHQRRAADAVLDQAAAQYRATVITAIQNVADSLYAIEFDAAALQADLVADHAAKSSWELAKQRYGIGSIPLVALMNLEQSYQQAEITQIAAQAARLSDTAGLFQALGGGWWNRTEEAKAE